MSSSFNYESVFGGEFSSQTYPVGGRAQKHSHVFREAGGVEPMLHVRRLSLPDALATSRHHHVHEHHHHVWNHNAPGAGGPPGWPPQPWQAYQPWYNRSTWQPWSSPPWAQQGSGPRCPTCGSGALAPAWLLEQFPWGEKAGKFSLLGGLLFLVVMGLCRGARYLWLVHKPSPPALE